MIALTDLSEERLRATGDRLRMRSEGLEISLVDEVQSPKRITPRE
jgi:hypothetical protein